MANLLEKASIILTPTAYDDGKVLAIKPSEAPYGDFDFTRNSSATRVNAQGLVEDVQILSSNLVQNGDFSEIGSEEVSNGDFSQEGSELVTNGDFSNGTTNWQNPTYGGNNSATLSIDNGYLKVQKNADLDWRTSFVNQTPITFTSGKTYKITYILKDGNTSGADVYVRTNFDRSASTVAIKTLTDDWVEYTDYYVADASANDISFGVLDWQNTGNGEYYFIDNVSVKEVGQGWTLGTGWSIGEDKAICDGNASHTTLTQSNSFTLGKTYKITFDIVVDSGNFKIQLLGSGTDSGNIISSTQVGYTEYISPTANRTTFGIRSNDGNGIGSITNISVKEVGQNWTVTNGTITDKYNASMTSYQSGVKVTPFNNTGKFKVKFDLVVTSGSCRFEASPTEDYIFNTSGTKEVIVTDTTKFEFNAFNLGWVGTLDNVSVIQITDDTNLPRINYSGFTYQDSLGSELVVNGGFDSDTDWTKGSGWAIANGVATHTGGASYLSQSILNADTQYKVNISVTAVSGGGFVQIYMGNSPASVLISTIGDYTYYFTSQSLQILGFALRSLGDVTIDNVSVKEYLGQEVVPDSGCGAWLFEPQSTNLITYSEDFSNASWSKASVSVVSNNYISPDGTQNASLLYPTTSGNFRYINENISGSSSIYTISVYAKVSGKDVAWMYINSSNSYGIVYYDLSDKTIEIQSGSTSTPSGTITDAGNGWYRLTYTIGSALALGSGSGFGVCDSKGSTNVTANGTDGLYIWGAQLEQQSYATSYIPTEGTIKTRNQDVCNNGGDVSLINSSEGVLYAEMSGLGTQGSTQTIGMFSTSGTAYSSRVLFRRNQTNNKIQALVYVNSAIQFNITSPSLQNEFNKVALKYKENDFALWINGIEIGTDNSGLTPSVPLSEVSFKDEAIGNPFFGSTKALGVWKEALTDAELRSLTYPTPTAPTFDLDFNTIATDFTFTRNSEATFVNAQGLIQSTNELGAELITNGDFATDSDWTKGTGWSINGGSANATVGSGGLIQSGLSIVSGKTYKVTFNVNINSGSLLYDLGDAPSKSLTQSGSISVYFVSQSTTAIRFFGNTFVGSIDNVSVKEYITETNTPRLDYSTGAEAFLLEPQRTNLINQSQLLDDYFNAKVDVSITDNYGLSPDGTNNSSRIVFSDETAYCYSAITASANQATSVYVKGVSGETLRFGIGLSVVGGDLFTLNGEWQRIEFIGSNLNQIFFSSYNGATARDIEAFGLQLEEGSYATSYIPTSGTTVTRNQELCYDATPVINSEEGVLYIDVAYLNDTGTFRTISINDGTNNNQVAIENRPTSNQIKAFVVVEGVSVMNSTQTLTDVKSFNKMALKWNKDNFSWWVNGVKLYEDASGDTFSNGTLTKLNFNNGTQNFPFEGNTKGLKIYPKALADVELQDLTTI